MQNDPHPIPSPTRPGEGAHAQNLETKKGVAEPIRTAAGTAPGGRGQPAA